jgi:tetratricopeptide (TPR) repeat protein
VLFNSANRFAEAEPLMRRALAIDEKAYGPDHPNVALRLYNLATLLQNTKRLEEAEPLFRRALAIWEQSLGKNHPNVGSCLTNLAQLLNATNRQGEAKLLLFRLLEAKGKVGQAEQLQFAVDLNNYAIDLRRLDRYTEAAAMLQRAIGIEDQYLTTDHPKRAHRRNNLAIIFMLADRLDEALHVNREAWSLKAGQHDMTSGRILLIRIALCLLKNAESNQYIGQLRTLIAQPEIPCLGDIARQWNVADILDKLRSRLSPERLDFLATLAVALNEPIKVTDLNGCAYWRSTLAVPLDVPWPDEPE